MNAARVYQHMTPMPHTIGRDQPLAKAHEMMRAHGIRHLPVLDGGALVGVVTDRDLRLLESVDGVDPKKTLVEEAMTPEPYVVSADTQMQDVVREMIAHKWGCAVIVEHTGVVGIFTTIDALRALVDLERAIRA